MNTQTCINRRDTAQGAGIELVEGEVEIRVLDGATSHLHVQAGPGRMQAQQAQFNVRYTGKNVVLATGSYSKSLPGLELASGPLVVVVGSEGKGLSRLVAQTCDQIFSIPMSAATESLNAGMAAAVTLYEVARLRAQER